MPPRLVTKGDMTSRRVLSVVFKILKCTSHLGIGLGAVRHCTLGQASGYRRNVGINRQVQFAVQPPFLRFMA